MATYLPNVKQYVSKSKAFTPNFKFLSDALARRQDRYDTNYQKMNNLYGSVIHADLSRTDNQELRDIYAEELAPKLQQISGVDFSLQQNVDAARGLFTPFFEDEKIVRDIVFTKRYQNEMKKFDSWKKSDDEEVRKRYWDGGVEMLNFQMDDFKNFTREESMNVQLPEAVHHVNLVEIGISKLKDLGMEVEDVSISEDGNYIITQKNGTLLTRRPIGKDKDGNMQYTNPAQNYILQTTLDDPRVRKFYHTKFYVNSRKFAEQNTEKYGGIDNAYKVFYDQTISDYTSKHTSENEQKETEHTSALEAKNNWEAYKEKYGELIMGSEEWHDYANAYNEYIAIANGRKLENKKHSLITSDIKDLNDSKIKALEAYMQYNIDADTKSAAAYYADINSSRTIKSDEFALANHKHRLTLLEKEQDAVNARMKVMLEKGYVLGENGELIPMPWAEVGGGGNNREGNTIGIDYYNTGSGTDVKAGQGSETSASYEVDGIIDFIAQNAETSDKKIGEIRNKRWEVIEKYYSSKAQDLGDDDNIYSSEGMYIDGKLHSWAEAKKHFLKDGNREEMTNMFENILAKANGEDTGPELQRDNPALYNLIMQNDDWIDTESTRLFVGWDKMKKVYQNVIDQLVAEGTLNSFQVQMLEAYPLFNKTGEVIDPKQIRGQMENDFVTWYETAYKNGEINHTKPSSITKAMSQKHDKVAKKFGFEDWKDLYKFIYPWNNTYGEHYSLRPPSAHQTNYHYSLTDSRMDNHFDNIYNNIFGKQQVQDLYSTVKDHVNRKMGSAEAIPGIQNFNMAAFLTGQDQTGQGGTIFNYFNSDYINGQVNHDANDQMRLINQLLNGPDQTYTVALGNRSASYTSDTDQGALNLMLEIIRDTKKDPNDFSKGTAPDFTISWSEAIGGVDGEGKHSGWIITLGEGYASTKKSTSNKWNNNIVDFNLPDNSITIFAPSEYAANNPNAVANTYVSSTEFLVDMNKSRVIHNDGGKVIFYKDSNGMMTVKHAVGIYDKNTGNIVYTNYSEPKILPLSGYEIDKIYNNYKQVSQQQIEVNNNARKAHKEELNKTN